MSICGQLDAAMASPAEYGQASGRAGMSGIMALVYSGNGHAEGLLQPYEMQHPLALSGKTCYFTSLKA